MGVQRYPQDDTPDDGIAVSCKDGRPINDDLDNRSEFLEGVDSPHLLPYQILPIDRSDQPHEDCNAVEEARVSVPKQSPPPMFVHEQTQTSDLEPSCARHIRSKAAELVARQRAEWNDLRKSQSGVVYSPTSASRSARTAFGSCSSSPKQAHNGSKEAAKGFTAKSTPSSPKNLCQGMRLGKENLSLPLVCSNGTEGNPSSALLQSQREQTEMSWPGSNALQTKGTTHNQSGATQPSLQSEQECKAASAQEQDCSRGFFTPFVQAEIAAAKAANRCSSGRHESSPSCKVILLPCCFLIEGSWNRRILFHPDSDMAPLP